MTLKTKLIELAERLAETERAVDAGQPTPAEDERLERARQTLLLQLAALRARLAETQRRNELIGE